MIKYPNGNSYNSKTKESKENKSKKNSTSSSSVDYRNRGMTLEDDINQSNEYYLQNQIAVVHKKPTPIQIVKVDYKSRSKAVIKEAYFTKASTTDYNGIFQGKYLDFEAKETKNKTSFPLSNFHEHQIVHMKSILNQKGIAFVIIRFSLSNQTYVLDAEHVIHFWENQDELRKSIPKLLIETKGELIKEGYLLRLDYISAIKSLYGI